MLLFVVNSNTDFRLSLTVLFGMNLSVRFPSTSDDTSYAVFYRLCVGISTFYMIYYTSLNPLRWPLFRDMELNTEILDLKNKLDMILKNMTRGALNFLRASFLKFDFLIRSKESGSNFLSCFFISLSIPRKLETNIY